jgi:hypothetical protein
MIICPDEAAGATASPKSAVETARFAARPERGRDEGLNMYSHLLPGCTTRGVEARNARARYVPGVRKTM